MTHGRDGDTKGTERGTIKNEWKDRLLFCPTTLATKRT